MGQGSGLSPEPGVSERERGYLEGNTHRAASVRGDYRIEWRGRQGRVMSRAIFAITVGFVGVTVCFANDWSYAHYSTLAKETGDSSINPAGDFFVAVPFALIAILVLVGGFGLLGAALATIFLALVTSAAYYGAWTGGTSTSVIALADPLGTGYSRNRDYLRGRPLRPPMASRRKTDRNT